MCQPRRLTVPIATGRKPVDESDLCRLQVAVGQRLEMRVGALIRGEFWRNPHHLGRHRPMRVRIGPPHDVIVLDPQDRETIEVVRADQRLDVRDVLRGDARSKLDDDATARELQVQRIFGIRPAPVRGAGRG